ncbi:hypothetical protein [Streptomyces sp. NPDC023838]|uniref:YncE family protein n=1 Tax=Streptomyces sp. NPDC023838 TaxID=3154325 RepID=UPI0033D8D10E
MPVIDTATGTEVTTVPVGDVPVGAAVAPDGRRAYITNSGSNSLTALDRGLTPSNSRAARVVRP